MKKLNLILALLTISAILSAQSSDSQSNKLIEDFVKSNFEVTIEPVEPAVISKVFSGKFYKILVGFVETGSGASSCGSNNYVSIDGGVVKMIEPVHMDPQCPVLLSLIRKDFLLKDENAAKLFESSLNLIYPVDEKEKQNVKHLRKGSQWIFLRGKFFDDYTAFIVTTAANGAVTGIELKLAYTVN